VLVRQLLQNGVALGEKLVAALFGGVLVNADAAFEFCRS
jgi:hypothetical protein